MSSANQPNVSKEGASRIAPRSEMRPCVVLSPIRPQKLAGARIEPAVSVPTAMLTSLPATAAADPEDEPPVTRSGAAELTGGGKCAFTPISEKANSSVCVLPTNRAPDSSSSFTDGAVSVDGFDSANFSGLPQPVRYPETANRSFTPSRRPASRPVWVESTGTCGTSRKAFRTSRVPGSIKAREWPKQLPDVGIGPLCIGFLTAHRLCRKPASTFRRDASAAPSFAAPVFSSGAQFLIDCEDRCPYIAAAQSRTCLWASPEPRNGEAIGTVPGK